MKKQILAFAAAFVTLFSLSFAASPYFFSGFVHVNGSLAPNGTTVEVAVNGVNRFNVTVGEGTLSGKAAGYYLISFEAESGNNVTFQVNGLALLSTNGTNNATQILTSSNIISGFNLSVNKSASGVACEIATGCTGGFCLHAVCRDASTFCGDSVCDSGETCSSCSGDCGACASSGGGSSGGGGGGGGPSLPSSTETVNSIPANTPTAVKVSDSKVAVSEIEITTSAAGTNVEVKVKEVSAPPSGSPSITISAGSGSRVYKYLDITTTATGVTNAKIKFKVAKSWLSQNSIDSGTVALSRLASGSWTKLSTKRVSDDATNVFYEAASPGFSTFAVTGAKGASFFDVITKIDQYYQGKAAFFDVIDVIDLYYRTGK